MTVSTRWNSAPRAQSTTTKSAVRERSSATTQKKTMISVKEDVFIIVKNEENIESIYKEIIIEKTTAPIKANEKVGVLKIKNGEDFLFEYELYSIEDVDFLHWYDYLIDLFLDMLL